MRTSLLALAVWLVTVVPVTAEDKCLTGTSLLPDHKNAGHYAFSDLCFPSPDCDPPVTRTQAEAHEAVLRYALPFLEVYLAGDTSFAPFLALPPGPGFVVQAEP
jgi:hypothetical protein